MTLTKEVIDYLHGNHTYTRDELDSLLKRVCGEHMLQCERIQYLESKLCNYLLKEQDDDS